MEWDSWDNWDHWDSGVPVVPVVPSAGPVVNSFPAFFNTCFAQCICSAGVVCGSRGSGVGPASNSDRQRSSIVQVGDNPPKRIAGSSPGLHQNQMS